MKLKLLQDGKMVTPVSFFKIRNEFSLKE